MEIDEVKNLDIEKVGDIEIIEAGIDEENLPLIFDMVSKNLYSDPIGSIVREITSNCFDAHIEAKTDEPVTIKKSFDLEEDQYYIHFIDKGLGMSPKRMENTYMKWFSSTKRKTNDEIGGFGIGGKSPLAYSDYYYIITTTKDEITEVNYKRTYVMSRGESKPGLSLLIEEIVESNTGTEIKIPVKRPDLYKFENALNKQLCYFDNVVFENWNIENDYRIFEGETFKIRSNYQYNQNLMHLCIGKVAYPIDFYILGLDLIEIPVAVKFNIGELKVTPSRENILYNEDSKVLIKERIETCLKELKKIYNKQNAATDNLIEYLSKRNTGQIVFKAGEELDDIQVIIKIPKKFGEGIKFKPFEELGIKCPKNPFFEYTINKVVSNNKRRSTYDLRYNQRLEVGLNNNYISFNYASNQTKLAYFYSQTHRFIIKEDKYTYPKFCDYLGIKTSADSRFSQSISTNTSILNDEAKEDLLSRSRGFDGISITKKIYTYRKIIKDYLISVNRDYDNLIVPEEWEKQYRLSILNANKAWRRKNEEKIIVRNSENSNPEEISITDLHSFKGILVYGTREDKNKLIAIEQFLSERKTLVECDYINVPSWIKNKAHYRNTNSKVTYRYDGNSSSDGDIDSAISYLNSNKARVYTIAKANEKHFQNQKNFINVNDFIDKHRILRDVTTAYMISKKFYLNKRLDNFEKINKDIANKIQQIKQFVKDNTVYSPDFGKGVPTVFMLEALSYAEKTNCYNPLILSIDKEIESYFKGVEFLKFSEINDESTPIIVKELIKRHKRVNKELFIATAPTLKDKVYNIQDIKKEVSSTYNNPLNHKKKIGELAVEKAVVGFESYGQLVDNGIVDYSELLNLNLNGKDIKRL